MCNEVCIQDSNTSALQGKLQIGKTPIGHTRTHGYRVIGRVTTDCITERQ